MDGCAPSGILVAVDDDADTTTQRNGDNYREKLLINYSLTIEAKAVRWVGMIRPTVEAQMRSNWVLTVSEMILFVAAVACMTGSFVLIAGG